MPLSQEGLLPVSILEDEYMGFPRRYCTGRITKTLPVISKLDSLA